MIVGVCSPKKKIEKTRKSKGEKVMEKAIESFIKYQNEAEEKFMKWEEERGKKRRSWKRSDVERIESMK